MSGLIDIGAILSLLAASSFAFHIQPRIINGVKSAPDAFPFYVLVRDGLSLCGGSVIDDRYEFIRNNGEDCSGNGKKATTTMS